MPGINPNSSAPTSGLVWDVDPSATAVFGDSPYNYSPTPPPSSSVFGKKLASVLDYMRLTIWPSIFDSLNLTQIRVIYRSQVIDPSDVLNVSMSETSLDVYGAVTGAQVQNIERGLVIASDYECLIAANDLPSVPTARRDAIRVDGVNYDVIGVMPCPQVPPAVGYRFFLRRAI